MAQNLDAETHRSAATASTPGDSEFAKEPVPASHQVGWLRVGLISAMVAFSLPTFLTGVEVFRATEHWDALAAIVVGCGLLTLIAALCGAIGTRTHLSSYMLARVAFGTRGAALVNLAFALSLLGWFGVNIDLFSGAILQLLSDTLAMAPPTWVIELIAGAVMTVTTLYGFKAINGLSALLVPVMMLVTALLLHGALADTSISALLSTPGTAELSLGDAISSVVGGVIIGAVILPDVTRFIRHWRGALYTALLSYLFVQSIVMTAGGLAALAFAQGDLLAILIGLGLSWAAFAILIAGSWVLNTLNLYSTALSIEATVPTAHNERMIVLLGALGTLAAFFNILDYFLTFLFYLAIVFVPVAGVIVTDHFVLRPQAYFARRIELERALSLPALLAWLAGSLVALLGAEGLLSLSGIAALDAMLVSGIAYAVLGGFLKVGSR